MFIEGRLWLDVYMALIRFKNHCEYALWQWLDNWPLSGHPLDEERFMIFAKTVARYRSKKWLDYNNFEQAVKSSKHPFSEEEIQSYFSKLGEFVKFYKVAAIPAIIHTNESSARYYQRGIIKGKMYQVPITEIEYFHGASKETLSKAELFD